jgi:hypothetical protein
MKRGGRYSAVGIATTRYGLEGPGIEFRCGAKFSALAQTGPGPTQPPTQWVPGLFIGGKRVGA